MSGRDAASLPSGVPVAQVADVLEAVSEILGADVLGAYLYGSAVAGGLRHRSDLDVLVLVQAEPDAETRAALVAALLPVGRRADRRPEDRSLELTVVVRSDVVPWRYPPRQAFQYGEWERSAYLAGFVPAPRGEPDLAVLLTIARARGIALAGPPVASVLAPVPAADLRRALLDLIPRLDGDLESDTANVILTMARAWVTLETGEIVPKDEAADWVLPRLPEAHRLVLARARDVYMGEATDRWDDLASAVRPAADALLAAIRVAAGPRRAEAPREGGASDWARDGRRRRRR